MSRKQLALRIACYTGIFASAGSAEFQNPSDLQRHILETREPPLTQLKVETVLDVTDFGAVSGDGKNDYPAFSAALKEARKSTGPVRIVFPKGTYHFASDIELSYDDGAFQLIGVRNLEIDGNGSELLITRSHMSLVYAKNCTNIIVRNFTVDYDPLPFTQGTIESVNAEDGSFVLKRDAGFPDPAKLPFSSPLFASFGVIMDPQNPHRLKYGISDHLLIGTRETLNGQDNRLFLKDKGLAKSLNPGDRFVLNCRAGAVARAFNTENITLQNITAYAIPGCFVQGAVLSKVNVLGCRALRKDNRMIVSGADGIHVQGARVGPWVEDCEFEGLLDDCFIVYNIPNYILEQPSSDRVKVSFQERVREGDRLVFFNPREGKVIKTVIALSVDKSGVRLSEPVEGLQIKPEDGTLLPPPKGNNTDHGWKELDHIYNLSTAGDYYVVRNNYFHDGRRYGIFLMASYGVVESNRVEGLSGTGLSVFNIPGFPGGLRACDLIIRNNRITDCGDKLYRSPVRFFGYKWGWGYVPEPLHKNIFFMNNRISGPQVPLVEIGGIADMELCGNTFIATKESGALVDLSISRDIRFSDNCYIGADGAARPDGAAIRQKPDCAGIRVSD
jgi:hypothetical protein